MLEPLDVHQSIAVTEFEVSEVSITATIGRLEEGSSNIMSAILELFTPGRVSNRAAESPQGPTGASLVVGR